jgi:hypothetical protein
MIKSVRICFDKILHDTGKAILIRINEAEHWIPKKLCRKLIISKKLSGNVCVPFFIAERIGLDVSALQIDIEIEHHIPQSKDTSKIQHDEDLFK